MLFEGCQGKRGVEIEEVTCPVCGNVVELMSSDVYRKCEECGATVYSSKMECTQRCPKARECVGDAYFERLLAAKQKWQADLLAQNDDEW